MLHEYWMTTIDNPYSYYDEFDKWYQYDMLQGYDTCGLIARIARTSEAFSDEENQKLINKAIDDWIEADPLHLYIRISNTSTSSA